MKKSITYNLLAICCLACICGMLCSCVRAEYEEVYKDPESSMSVSQEETVYDIFENASDLIENQEDLESDTVGTSTYSGLEVGDVLRTEAGRSYINYNGDDVELSISFEAGGKDAEQIGLLLFVNGVPHPYRVELSKRTLLREVKEDQDETRYMHTFKPNDGSKVNCTLVFSPMLGEEGDTLEVCVVMCTYPDGTMDDANQTQIHKILSVVTALVYCETPSPTEKVSEKVSILTDKNIMLSDLTEEKKIEFIRFWNCDVHSWEKSPRARLWIGKDSKTTSYEYEVTNENYIDVKLEVLGTSLVRYKAIVYINHEPVNVLEEDQITLELQQGQVTTLEMEVDVSELDGTNLFYIMLIPENYREMNDIGITVKPMKTPSVWLVIEEK